uniref:Uncharacterized protein n=1 Tax=Eiseniibacteriota bacterium TaxID=2212470 RepID=A0A832MMA2_UNCEI
MRRGIVGLLAVVVALAAVLFAVRGARHGASPPAPPAAGAPAPAAPLEAAAPPAAGAAGEAPRARGPGEAVGAAERTSGGLALRAFEAPGGARLEIGFRSPQSLLDHFARHGAELGAATPSEYLALAQALRDAPAGGDVLEAVRADGVVTRFDRATGTFVAFDRDLVIRTCFKPNDGERYFRRQAARAAEVP